MRPRTQIPLGVVRDLLGIVRAVYRAEQRKPAPEPGRLAALVTIGEQLSLALELGQGAPDTMGGRAAWGWAGKAGDALSALAADLELEPAVRATLERLKR